MAMPEPFLNFFQAYTICKQQARATVAKIVETNMLKPMLFKNNRKMLRDISRLDSISKFVHVDVLLIFVAIGVFEQGAIFLLFFPQSKQ